MGQYHKIAIKIFLLLFVFGGCSNDSIQVLSEQQKVIQANIPSFSLIAHRGTCTWAPEHTEAAMRWARNAGATYLECDLQRTADGYLVLYHDESLLSKSNISQVYSNLTESCIRNFTLEELLLVDFGSWFNRDHADHARKTFKNLDIITLEDLIKIAEGYRIKRDNENKRLYHKENNRIITEYEPDPNDNGNRPGIYIEIKYPDLYPNMAQDIKQELERLGWYANHTTELKEIITFNGRVSTANTTARVVIQTLHVNTLQELDRVFPRKIPFCLLIAASENEHPNEKTYRSWINNAVKNGAVILAPSIPADAPDNFADLLQPWMYDLIRESGLLIHAFTFQTREQIEEYEDRVDGVFCNQTEIAVDYFTQKHQLKLDGQTCDARQILDDLGY